MPLDLSRLPPVVETCEKLAGYEGRTASLLKRMTESKAPDIAEAGKAFQALWADGRARTSFKTKAAVRAHAKKSGAWAEYCTIKYAEGPATDDERDLIQHLMRLAWESGGRPLGRVSLLAEHKRKLMNTVLLQAIKRASTRLLPGARLIRSARPMTDILTRFKKIQRRALRGSIISYRRSVKANQKALVTGARRTARSSYKRR